MTKADRFFGNSGRYHAWADWFAIARERGELDPCEYGHFNCSSTGEDGACSDEVRCDYEAAHGAPLLGAE